MTSSATASSAGCAFATATRRQPAQANIGRSLGMSPKTRTSRGVDAERARRPPPARSPWSTPRRADLDVAEAGLGHLDELRADHARGATREQLVGGRSASECANALITSAGRAPRLAVHGTHRVGEAPRRVARRPTAVRVGRVERLDQHGQRAGRGLDRREHLGDAARRPSTSANSTTARRARSGRPRGAPWPRTK